MMRAFPAAAVVAAMLTAGAATAAPASAAPASSPQTAGAHAPPACPARPPARVAHNPWRATKRQLAPAGALQLRLCRYSSLNQSPPTALERARLIRDRHLVGALVQEFDQLAPAPRGPVACPADDGSRILALLSYPHGRHATILVELSGCLNVGNGDTIRTAAEPRSGSNLIYELEMLTQPSRAR